MPENFVVSLCTYSFNTATTPAICALVIVPFGLNIVSHYNVKTGLMAVVPMLFPL